MDRSIDRGSPSHRGLLRLAAMICLLLSVVGGSAAQVRGQVMRTTVPTDGYFVVLGGLYDGDYAAALQGFQSCLQGAVKTSSSFWIDSICYHTMCGECLFQMGQHGPALEQFNKALRLQITFNDWLIPVKFNQVITPAQQASLRPIPWGQPQRQMIIGSFPDSILIQQGSVDQTQKIASGGGVIQQATQVPINPQEIVRCVCLSLRRRHQILGPLAPFDKLAGELISVLTKRMVQPNHWSEAWVDVMLGCAFAAVGKDAQAKPLFDKSILAGGQYDHPMTSVALVELGRIALISGNYDLATKYFQEASYSAFYFVDPIVMEDALRLAATTHFLANRGGAYVPLALASNWARLQGFYEMYASLMILIAENQCLLDQADAAATTLDNIRSTIGRSNMLKACVGARLSFTQAHVNYQLGNSAGGDTAVNFALAFARTGSLSLFRMDLADRKTVDRSLTTREASEIFNELLRDPQPGHWLYDPLDAMATLVH
ncbi:MAG: tetratricopeptide repeat protein, partial [Planctomycetia bacterium]|nr:tetratricopeptide repeat protein [Planctomycetia bacterium]